MDNLHHADLHIFRLKGLFKNFRQEASCHVQQNKGIIPKGTFAAHQDLCWYLVKEQPPQFGFQPSITFLSPVKKLLSMDHYMISTINGQANK
jgi:hypothetical protein